MFGLFKKSIPTWNKLAPAQQVKVAKQISKHIRAMAGARYKIVSGFDQTQRERGIAETQIEDKILNGNDRGRLLDLTRNAVRNSSTFNTILKQFDYNVCGTKAGKAIINFPDIELSKELKWRFADYTRSVDFFDGYNFNQVLKLIYKNALIGGDICIVFDNGICENSGKLILLESDEIGNTTEDAIKKHFGKYATQSLGKVYSLNQRWIGTVVSRSQRGKEIFDPDCCWFLHRDPDASVFDSFWIQPANVYRPSQGRGISQAASSLGTVLDLEDLCGFELQAAKKNAQTFAQIVHQASDAEAEIPSAFDKDTDFSGMTDEEIEEAVKSEADIQEQTISFQKAQSAGIIYEAMPDNYKMELLQTEHPNTNVQDFVKWLAGRSSAVFGLSEAYATLMPTGADFRAQQLLTQPAFLEGQKWLEQICDWTLYQFVNWIDAKGEFDKTRLPEHWMRYVSWSFPTIDEVDETAHQNAVQMKLSNLTGSLKDELGSDWREKLEQIKEEIAYCKSNGLPHPSFNMKSGGERSETAEQTLSSTI